MRAYWVSPRVLFLMYIPCPGAKVALQPAGVGFEHAPTNRMPSNRMMKSFRRVTGAKRRLPSLSAYNVARACV